MTERRQWQRYSLDLPIRVEGTDQSGSAFSLTGRLRNISARGALGNIPCKLQVGSDIRLEIGFPFSRLVWMRFDCEVLRTETTGTGVDTALRFTSGRPLFSYDETDS